MDYVESCSWLLSSERSKSFSFRVLRPELPPRQAAGNADRAGDCGSFPAHGQPADLTLLFVLLFPERSCVLDPSQWQSIDGLTGQHNPPEPSPGRQWRRSGLSTKGPVAVVGASSNGLRVWTKFPRPYRYCMSPVGRHNIGLVKLRAVYLHSEFSALWKTSTAGFRFTTVGSRGNPEIGRVEMHLLSCWPLPTRRDKRHCCFLD